MYHESILACQFLRSGTSIGANLAEGRYAQTNGDAVTKYSIAQKEAAETQYWIVLFKDMGVILPDKPYSNIYLECNKILDLIGRLIKSKRKAYMREKEARHKRRACHID